MSGRRWMKQSSIARGPLRPKKRLVVECLDVLVYFDEEPPNGVEEPAVKRNRPFRATKQGLRLAGLRCVNPNVAKKQLRKMRRR